MIKKILLGSAAVLALGTSAQAADPIAVALDTCDLLNITGLTISSETNCLQFTGEVSYKWKAANYDLTPVSGATAGTTEWNPTASTLDWKLAANAYADSDFGRAMANITLVDNANGTGVIIDKAYVSIGDIGGTILSAGKKGSIAATGDDETFTKIYDLDSIDGEDEGLAQVGTTGGYVLQVETVLGDGVKAGLALEDLGPVRAAALVPRTATVAGTAAKTISAGSLVASVDVTQAWGSAHASFVYDDIVWNTVNTWGLHAGATFNVDSTKIRAAFETDNASAWSALLAAESTFDMFTLAAGVEFYSTNAWEAAISGEAKVDDNVTLTAAVRLQNGALWDVAVKGAFKVSDTLTATAQVSFDEANASKFSGDLDWAPGGDTTVNLGVDYASNGNASIETKFKKTFK